jgi:drug/metabolite transporter (DMT)-like permease
MTHSRLTPRAWAELLLLSLIWGGSFLAIRTALDAVPVLTSVAHRVGWAALALWVVVLATRTPVPRAPRIWGAFLVMGLLNNAIPFTLMAWGQLHIETGLASILNAATAIWGTLAAAAVFADERLSARKVAGVATGFAGVLLAVGVSALGGLDLRSAGQIAVIAGTISYALAAVWARARLGGLAPVVAAAGMLTGSSVVMIPLALAVDGPPRLDLPPVTWGAIGYAALASTAFAYLLYYRVLAVAGSANLLLCTLMIPPVAILLGAWARDEALPPHALAGFAVSRSGSSSSTGASSAASAPGAPPRRRAAQIPLDRPAALRYPLGRSGRGGPCSTLLPTTGGPRPRSG